MRSVALFCHESTPTPFVRSLQVSLDDDDEGRVSLRYDLQGDIQRLRIPPPSRSARVDELWRHTCFEAFFKPADAAGYLELNFAPSSEWAAYEFNGYRAGMTAAAIVAPTITCARSPSHLETLVSVNIPPSHRRRVRLALSAVIEDDEGCLSYWALAHPRGKPDFHHDDGFALGC